jgi:hypothetical protein
VFIDENADWHPAAEMDREQLRSNRTAPALAIS